MEREIDLVKERVEQLGLENLKTRAYAESLRDKYKIMQIELLISEIALVTLVMLHILGK